MEKLKDADSRWYRYRWGFIAYAPGENATWRIDRFGKWCPVFLGLWVNVRS